MTGCSSYIGSRRCRHYFGTVRRLPHFNAAQTLPLPYGAASYRINPALPLAPLPSRTRWIISRRDDLVWLIGSAAISYLALALMTLGFPS
jgi:hypothetical protein